MSKSTEFDTAETIPWSEKDAVVKIESSVAFGERFNIAIDALLTEDWNQYFRLQSGYRATGNLPMISIELGWAAAAVGVTAISALAAVLVTAMRRNYTVLFHHHESRFTLAPG